MPDSTGHDPVQPSLRATLDEHHGCMHAVTEVEDVLSRHPDPPDRWLSDLMRKLDALRATLAEHFESEQEGALFRELPLKKPELAGKIERLAVEHGAMLAAIDSLKQRGTSQADSGAAQLRELNGGAQRLIATIRRHEAEENEIILSAYWTETGAGD